MYVHTFLEFEGEMRIIMGDFLKMTEKPAELTY